MSSLANGSTIDTDDSPDLDVGDIDLDDSKIQVATLEKESFNFLAYVLTIDHPSKPH